jgi:hypothetical protein
LEAGAGRLKLNNEKVQKDSQRSDFHFTAELNLLEFVLIGIESLAIYYVLSNDACEMNAPVPSPDGMFAMLYHRRWSFLAISLLVGLHKLRLMHDLYQAWLATRPLLNILR